MSYRIAFLVATISMIVAGASESRPRDPWVFRCVLDQHPRMVVIAAREGLWLAYDATTCGPYKVWAGDVAFDGAVHTTVHGPQPTSKGRALLDHAPVEGVPMWRLTRGGEPVESTLLWRGYRFEGDDVTLLYELVMPDGVHVHIHETPDIEISKDGMIQFVRRLELRNVPANHEVWTSVPTRRLDGEPVLYTSGAGKYAASPGEPDVTPFRINANGITTLTATLGSAKEMLGAEDGS